MKRTRWMQVLAVFCATAFGMMPWTVAAEETEEVQSEETRAKSAEYFFKYKSNTEGFLKSAQREYFEGLLKQKEMVEKIEAAIEADIPKVVPLK